jgi:hypothetical protein
MRILFTPNTIGHTLILLFSFLTLQTLSAANFSSLATGNWNAAGTWTVTSGTDMDNIPDSDDNVIINSHTVTLTQDEFCINLTISSPSANRLALGANTLTVSGVATCLVSPSVDNFISSGVGRLKLTAASGTLLNGWAGFGGGTNGFDIEIAGGTVTLTSITTTKFKNMYISSGTVTAGGEIRIDGTGVNGSGSVVVDGTLICGRIGNRVSSPTNTYCGSITVNGTLETNNVNIHADAVTINGTLRLKSSGALGSNGGSATSGWTYGASSTVEYNVNSGSMGAEVDRAGGNTIPKVVINTPTGSSSISSNFKLPVIGTLQFTSGKLNANSRVTIASGGDITGEDATKYVIATSSTGVLARRGLGSGEFPIGTSTLYLPITAFSNGGTSDEFRAFVTATAPSCVPSVEAVTATWDITEVTAGGSDCSITFDFAGAATGANYNASFAQIRHCTGAVNDYSNGSVTGTIATGAGFTTFSPFGVSGAAPAPLELTSFTGKNNGAVNTLAWETATEKNVQWHIVERSANGSKWTEVGRKAALNDARNAMKYEMEDKTPLARTYYRLRSVDFEGAENISRTVVVTRTSDLFSINTAYPSPTSDRVVVQFNSVHEADVIIRVSDLMGRIVFTQNWAAADGINDAPVSLQTLQAGVYMITVADGNTVTAPVRVVKQ